MEAILTSRKRVRIWFDKTAKLLIKRGKKHIRKRKGQKPKLSAWEIIKLLA